MATRALLCQRSVCRHLGVERKHPIIGRLEWKTSQAKNAVVKNVIINVFVNSLNQEIYLLQRGNISGKHGYHLKIAYPIK